MIAILQWTTLAVCGLLAAARVPSAVRGQNRSLFGIFVLMTFALALSIDVGYTALDSFLGGHNVANLLLRFVIYGAVMLAGYRIAKGFDSARSVWFIVGPIGMAVLAAVSVATVVPFLMANTAGTSTGLTHLPDQSPHNTDLIRLYTVAGRFYPSYVAACLLPPILGVLKRRILPRVVRAGAAMLLVGAVAMIVLSLSDMLPRSLAYLQYVISSTAVLGLAVGLALIWVGRVRAARKPLRR
ncbi:hypothetical protein SAMN04487916_11242 [Arthrobacter sp. ov407]|uniref:hypothetical protein n=1 Tax=Arthrobacter sp. ov407 TaxID=1761748 RepID=UPI000890E72B|nr:hypothetical protein [Arthrobacter sp. ov407]SDL65662.1 hypothetical protein SAMN04487916_11242 [Arthrobacter sp. ov407]